jgi:hypothetical protein
MGAMAADATAPIGKSAGAILRRTNVETGADMKYLALMALLFAHACYANGLDDLRGALGTLQGKSTLRGTFDARQQSTEKGKATEAAHARAFVEEDENSLQVRWDRSLLKRANDEARPPKGTKKHDALSALIGTASAVRMSNAMNYAPIFLKSLEDGELKSEKADTWQGRPVRLLELSLVEPNPDEEHVKIKESTHLAQVWMASDGTPLAARITHKRRASVMLVISFEQEAREDFVFVVVGNRLVVRQRDEQGTASGLGTEAEYRNTYIFQPKM